MCRLFRLTITLFFIFSGPLFTGAHNEPARFGFIENKGQWPAPVLFRGDFSGATMFLEASGFTYVYRDEQALQSMAHSFRSPSGKPLEKIAHHSIRMHFEGSSKSRIVASHPQSGHYNFYYGSDPTRWKSNVRRFADIFYQDLYPGIDLQLYEKNGTLKYDLLLEAGADPQLIRLHYQGADRMLIKNGNLIVKTSLGELLEQQPVAWQFDSEGNKRNILCTFHLEDDVVTFDFPEGYDRTLPLVIDPVLIFSSYSGSTADNFGMTATYDNQGNLISGGMAFATGYPVTTGAYDISFSGPSGTGLTDVVISKYNPTGTGMIYSTYLGGSGTETINSMVVDGNDELLVYGVTSSNDFPTTTGCYDSTFNGGTFLDLASPNGTRFNLGTDIYISKFNTTGTTLLGSTYIGGSANDGVNINTGNPNLIDSLHFNYGDVFRGEIIVDSLNLVYVTSSTRSSDFPVLNPVTATLQGEQDAVVFKMNTTLTSLVFSTFLGGNGKDAGYSLKTGPLQEVYVTGGTSSPNFPATTGVLQPFFQGGMADGFITILNPSGSGLLASTYMGTVDYDQTFFIELDRFGNVYVLGQSLGNIPVSPGVYSNPNSGQFIIKMNNALSLVHYSTVFGNGNGNTNISPSAFLVDYCENVYVSGWGGSLSTQVPTTGMPLTANAFQSTTDGFNFYLIVFERNMSSLLYATYFGGSISQEHVDGGTSRFDKNGIIYQSVCAGCGNNDDFPTTAGVVSNTNNSNNCNNGVFKFDFQIMPRSSFQASDTAGCVPFTVNFSNQSVNYTTYIWDFGSNDTTSTVLNPVRTYNTPGIYPVSLIVTDTICGVIDTMIIQIEVYDPINLSSNSDSLICDTGMVTLSANAGGAAIDFVWSDDPFFFDTLNTNGDSIIVLQPQTGYYYIHASNPGCFATDSVLLTVDPILLTIPDSLSICQSDTFFITALNQNPGQTLTYNWSPSPPIFSGNGTPTIQVAGSGDFSIFLTATSPSGCIWKDTTQVHYSSINFQLSAFPDTMLCSPQQLTFTASNQGAGSYFHWSGNPLFTDTLNSQFSDSVLQLNIDSATTIYIRSSVLGCTRVDSLSVDYFAIEGYASGSTACNDEEAPLTAVLQFNYGTGLHFEWQPASELAGPNNTQQVNTNSTGSGLYTLVFSNDQGCTDTASTLITRYSASANATAEPDTILAGMQVQLDAIPSGTAYNWSPVDGLSDQFSPTPTATPSQTTTYNVVYLDSNGCLVSDSVTVVVTEIRCEDPYVFIPNAFTPNGDEVNDVLVVSGQFLKEIDLKIYDRWGELVFQSMDPKIGWDGTYKGRPADPAVFVYHLRVICVDETEFFTKGNVTLIR